MISINTYHIACAEGSALQCCSCKFALQTVKIRAVAGTQGARVHVHNEG